MATFNFKGQEVYIDGFLKEKLDNVKYILKRGWDCMSITDGKERSGKSTIDFVMLAYLFPDFSLKNVAKNGEDALEKIKNLPNGSPIMVDEGSLIFSSKDAMMKEQRNILKVMDVVGQKNMFFGIVLPSFFDLIKHIAVRRSRFLIHVYTDKKLNRGRFAYFGEKKKEILYEYGKKHFGSYAYPKADFRGRFIDFNPFGEEYFQFKRETLETALTDKKAEARVKVSQDVKKKTIMNFIERTQARGINMTAQELAHLFDCHDETIKQYKAELRVRQPPLAHIPDITLMKKNKITPSTIIE